MRGFWIVLAALVVAVPVVAQDLGNVAPAKIPDGGAPPPPPDPAVLRQGGDTISDAFVIPGLPFTDAGTTAGYTNDYDVICPYTFSIAPDVVYTFTPFYDLAVDIDLCYSSYDTKVYVYDSSLQAIACNDDYYLGAPCYPYTSRLENVPLSGGEQYYIVVDGYSNASGPYVLDVTEILVEEVPCPAGATLEGEPTLIDGYVDAYNGGCNSPDQGYPFQHLEDVVFDGMLSFCGISGWYTTGGADYRDTDWIILRFNETGEMSVTIIAEQPTYLYELGPQDCDAVQVLQSVLALPLSPQEMHLTGDPNALEWIWVGPQSYTPPGPGFHEYDYLLIFEQEVVATETATWGDIKSVFR